MRKIINKDNLPQHLAIIMDGNGRWAQRRLLTKAAGHKAGAETLRKISKEIEKLGIKHLTVFAFSTENWKREEKEVNAIMELLRQYLQEFIDDVDNNNTRVDVIGDISCLSGDIQEKVKTLTKLTINKTGSNLHIALNYGGRDEVIRAMKKVISDVEDKKIKANDIDEDLFSNYLDTKGIPDPEMMIRTSGELRLSNFMLWQLAYTELYFSDKLWPDFNREELYVALSQFQKRNRRFGGRN